MNRCLYVRVNVGIQIIKCAAPLSSLAGSYQDKTLIFKLAINKGQGVDYSLQGILTQGEGSVVQYC